MNLFQNETNVSAAARAVRAYLGRVDGVESSWDGLRYEAEPQLAEWYNDRERGYVIWLVRETDRRQLNLVFFEHRNSDDICALEWCSDATSNPPTLADVPDDHPWLADKYAPSHTVDVRGAYDMARWLLGRMEAFWSEGRQLRLGAR